MWLSRRKNRMPALSSGVRAPEVSLPLLGGGKFELASALKRGPVLLVFFKISCPVCQMALPYLQRIYQHFPGSKLQIVGISQNDAKATAGFLKEYDLTFPIALDDPERYPVSNAYGLTNVPTLFLVNENGNIEMSTVGWSRADVQSIADDVAQRDGAKPFPVFRANEAVPDFKAG
jgi:peroxiredoxin